jgi:orotate phosphoribosyltransferase
VRVRDERRVDELLSAYGGGSLPGVRDLFVRTGALLEGHFRLQSGLHSPYFVRVGQLAYRPEDARVLAECLVAALGGTHVERLIVLAASNSGRYVGEALAGQLGVPIALAGIDGWRRPTAQIVAGDIPPGSRVLVVTDVITTGASVTPLIEIARAHGEVERLASVVVLDSGRFQELLAQNKGVRGTTLLSARWTSSPPEQCPQCALGQPLFPALDLT